MGIARGLIQKGPRRSRGTARGPRGSTRCRASQCEGSVTIAENTLIELVRHEGELTKSDLVIHSDFSRTKITTCIDSLLDKKILVANQTPPNIQAGGVPSPSD